MLRTCADLGVPPDWSLWEAGDWATCDAPVAAATPVPAPTRRPVRPSPRVRLPPILPDFPEFAARAADTARARVFLAGLNASGWRLPRL